MSNGDIWVGTRRGGLYNYDSHLKTKIDNHYLPYNIYAISEDSQENIWMNPGDGLKIGDTWYKTDPSNLLPYLILIFIPFFAIRKIVCGWEHLEEDWIWQNQRKKDNTSSVVSFKERSMAYG